MTELCDIAKKYEVDKLRNHNYTPFYHQLLNFRRETVRKVLEIGIYKGASLRMWREYFPHAEIYGIDILPIVMTEDRIHTYQYDQTNAAQLEQLPKDFDLIVDDGSHRSRHQIFTANFLRAHLAPEGMYIIEDVRYPDSVRSQTGGAIVDLGKINAKYNDNRLIIL